MMIQLIYVCTVTDATICRVRSSGLISSVFGRRVAHWQRCGLIAFLLAATPGCTTPGARLDDMSAEAHRDTAEANREEAVEHRKLYDPTAFVTRPYRYGSGYGYGGYGGYALRPILGLLWLRLRLFWIQL